MPLLQAAWVPSLTPQLFSQPNSSQVPRGRAAELPLLSFWVGCSFSSLPLSPLSLSRSLWSVCLSLTFL